MQVVPNSALGSDSIVLSPVPSVISISGGDTYCTGDAVNPIEVEVQGTGPFELTYTLNNVSYTVNSATTTFNLGTNAGNYVVTAVSDAYCSNTASLTDAIVLLPLPNVNAGQDVIVCDGNSTVLSGSGAVSYQWDNGISNAVPFYPNATQTYTVTGTDVNGCINTDAVTVTFEALPVVSFTANITEGCAPLEVQFTNTTQGNLASCVWQFRIGRNANRLRNGFRYI